MTRAVLIVLDSLGVGGAPDAGDYGDFGADTLGHVAEACAQGRADRDGLRRGLLAAPNFVRLGLGRAAALGAGHVPPGLGAAPCDAAAFGCAVEISRGKDTPSGHWELAGLPVELDWGYLPDTAPALPDWLETELVRRCGLPGLLGRGRASGTQILRDLGEAHLLTGSPIVYTSADSVLQIAAHEDRFGLDRLYEVCGVARELVDAMNLCRVIARPFVGRGAESFRRTANRRDFATPPHGATLLDVAAGHGREVHAIGKIDDIFTGRGVTAVRHGDDDQRLFDATIAALGEAGDGALVFSNLVDLDQSFGHRRDVAGYAAAIEAIDRRIPELEAALRPGDLAIFTADHGCDPTWRGTDHTRETVPVLAFGPAAPRGSLGRRDSFSDVGQSIARHLGLPALARGCAWP